MKLENQKSSSRIEFNPATKPPTREEMRTARREILGKLRAREYNLIITRAALVLLGVISYRLLDEQNSYLLLLALAGLFISVGFILQGFDYLSRNPVTRRNLSQRLRDFDRLSRQEFQQANELIRLWPELESYAYNVRTREGRRLVYGELLMFMEFDQSHHQRSMEQDALIGH